MGCQEGRNQGKTGCHESTFLVTSVMQGLYSKQQ